MAHEHHGGNLALEPIVVNESSLGQFGFSALLTVRTGRVIRYTSRLTMALLLLSVVAMLFVPWQQTSRGYGRVIAFSPEQRPQQVKATAKGIVSGLRPGLREGTYVNKGDVVLEIEPLAREAQQQLENQLSQIEAKIATGEAKRALVEQAVEFQRSAGEAIIRSAEQAVEAAEAKVKQAQEKVSGLDASVDRTKADYDRNARLFKDGLKAERDYIKAKEDYLKAVADFEAGESAVVESLKNLASKEQDLISKTKEVEVKNRETEAKLQETIGEIANARKELSELQQKLSEFGKRLQVVSPQDGYLHEIYSLIGADVVKEGDVLFTVVPITSELAVELIVRGNDIPLLHINDEVRLQFEGYPAIQFVGWPSAAIGTFGGRVALINPTDDGLGNFRVVVIPDKSQHEWPDSRYLRQGVLANGWVLLSTNEGKLSQVSLGYEIWRQLNGFPPVISQNPPGDKPKGGKDKDDVSKIKLPK